MTVKSKFKSAFSPRERVRTEVGTISRTKQAFKNSTDINKIMEKYQKTGILNHINTQRAQYDFATSLDFKSAVDLINEAEEMFNALPSYARERFENKPEHFLDWVQDPANQGFLDNPEDFWQAEQAAGVPVHENKEVPTGASSGGLAKDEADPVKPSPEPS